MARPDVPPVILEIQKDVLEFLNPKGLPSVGAAGLNEAQPVPCTDLASLVEAREAVATCSAELEALQREAKARSEEQTRRAAGNSATLQRLKRERDDLAEEGAKKCRKMETTEQDANHLRIEIDTLRGEIEDLRNHQQQKRRSAERGFEEESGDLKQEIDHLRNKIAETPGLVKSALSSEEDALTTRLAELEKANKSLRVVLEHQATGNRLEARLQEAHQAHADELKEAQQVRRKVTALQEKVQRLRQDAATFQASLQERDKLLEAHEASARSAAQARKDVAAFRRAVEPIVGPKKDPTCLHLKGAWVQLQSHVEDLERQKKTMQEEHRGLQEKKRDAETQAAQNRIEECKMQKLVEERSKKLSEHLDQHADAAARISVLQQVCDGSSSSAGGSIAAFEVTGDLGSQSIEAAGKICHEELEQLRIENACLIEAAQRTIGLQRISDELKTAIADVKNEIEGMDVKLSRPWPPSETSGTADELKQEYRCLKEEIQLLEVSQSALVSEDGAADDLETRRQEAERQLERYKRATKQNIQDFREGIYLLMGWKVDQRGSGKDVRWHLTSKYQPDKELAFGRGASSGGEVSVDLLNTRWAEELQRSPADMAFLEKRSSVPGFLAHLTHECLAKSTLPH